MSKITFRADDDLVSRLEAFDASKSEVMRDALRYYLDTTDRETREAGQTASGGSIDDLIGEQIDRMVAERVDTALENRIQPSDGQTDVSVNITLEGAAESASVEQETVQRKTDEDEHARDREGETAETVHNCSQCGEEVDSDHVYCPNCGAKASHRLFCECGDELRSDWSFCPGCGRRTPAADVLETN